MASRPFKANSEEAQIRFVRSKRAIFPTIFPQFSRTNCNREKCGKQYKRTNILYGTNSIVAWDFEPTTARHSQSDCRNFSASSMIKLESQVQLNLALRTPAQNGHNIITGSFHDPGRKPMHFSKIYPLNRTVWLIISDKNVLECAKSVSYTNYQFGWKKTTNFQYV